MPVLNSEQSSCFSRTYYVTKTTEFLKLETNWIKAMGNPTDIERVETEILNTFFCTQVLILAENGYLKKYMIFYNNNFVTKQH